MPVSYLTKYLHLGNCVDAASLYLLVLKEEVVMNDQSVTVVGCGPVGALAALALARKGLDVTLIEADSSPNLSPRAIVYLHPVLPDFKELGILDDMVARGHLDHEGFNMHLVALDEVLSAPNTLLEGISPTPFNVHMGQGELVTIVLEHLGRMPNVTVLWGTTVESVEQDESGVELGLRTGDQLSTHRTGWAIGADGGRSVLRDHIGGKLDGFTWDERFVAINLYHDYRAEGFFSSNLYVHPTLPAVRKHALPQNLQFPKRRELIGGIVGDARHLQTWHAAPLASRRKFHLARHGTTTALSLRYRNTGTGPAPPSLQTIRTRPAGIGTTVTTPSPSATPAPSAHTAAPGTFRATVLHPARSEPATTSYVTPSLP
jgi:hypothetical protein